MIEQAELTRVFFSRYGEPSFLEGMASQAELFFPKARAKTKPSLALARTQHYYLGILFHSIFFVNVLKVHYWIETAQQESFKTLSALLTNSLCYDSEVTLEAIQKLCGMWVGGLKFATFVHLYYIRYVHVGNYIGGWSKKSKLCSLTRF